MQSEERRGLVALLVRVKTLHTATMLNAPPNIAKSSCIHTYMRTAESLSPRLTQLQNHAIAAHAA